MNSVKVGEILIGDNNPLVLIAGPCVIESQKMAVDIALRVKSIAQNIGMKYIFKASYDKANRSSLNSYRGPGIDEGIKILKTVKETAGVPVLTDVHCSLHMDKVAQVADIIQIPAFLCRQTDLLLNACATGKTVNVKKGQFLAPWDIKNIIDKCYSTGNRNLLITERGVSFGYNNLVNDMRAFPIIRAMGVPVIFDATHSVQLPGAKGASSGGEREFVRHLSRSAVAAGCDGIFFECHPVPDKALCDGQNSLAVDELEEILLQLVAIDKIVKNQKPE